MSSLPRSSESESSPEGTDSVSHVLTVNKNADGVAGVSSTSLNLERFWHSFPPIFPLQKGKTIFLSWLIGICSHVPITQVLNTIAPILSVPCNTVWLSLSSRLSGKTPGLSIPILIHAITLQAQWHTKESVIHNSKKKSVYHFFDLLACLKCSCKATDWQALLNLYGYLLFWNWLG